MSKLTSDETFELGNQVRDAAIALEIGASRIVRAEPTPMGRTR